MDREIASCVGAIAEAEQTPAPDATIQQRARMHVVQRNLLGPLQVGDRYEGLLRRWTAIHLRRNSYASDPECRAYAAAASPDANTQNAGCDNRDRNATGCGASVAQLEGVIRSPTRNTPVAQCAGVAVTGSYCLCGVGHRCHHGFGRIHRGVVAELTFRIGSPTENSAIHDSANVVESRRY